jgi:NAD(P)-dependent dehydrogenase (short-subunit alcohol dehydrogenase family)
VADQITAMHPGGAIPIRCDVTNGDDVQAMVKRVVAEWGVH